MCKQGQGSRTETNEKSKIYENSEWMCTARFYQVVSKRLSDACVLYNYTTLRWK